ncbi:MAG: EVE domain-containing protein [Planctomycetota bacterium]|jgi:predicted RNA-binding protein with PUA-like domain|nr:EVE domain-containing protein [Planctomycetota bacterium]
MRYWLMKSEPNVFGINHLEKVGTEPWDGVRNYQARNFMRDDMRVGDKVLFYHSNSKPSGVAGLAKVVRTGYPDHTSWDPESKYHDPKSTPETPRWFMVDLGYVSTFKQVVSLDEMRQAEDLADMVLLNRSRLSVQPVDKAHYDLIVAMGKNKR